MSNNIRMHVCKLTQEYPTYEIIILLCNIYLFYFILPILLLLVVAWMQEVTIGSAVIVTMQLMKWMKVSILLLQWPWNRLFAAWLIFTSCWPHWPMLSIHSEQASLDQPSHHWMNFIEAYLMLLNVRIVKFMIIINIFSCALHAWWLRSPLVCSECCWLQVS